MFYKNYFLCDKLFYIENIFFTDFIKLYQLFRKSKVGYIGLRTRRGLRKIRYKSTFTFNFFFFSKINKRLNFLIYPYKLKSKFSKFKVHRDKPYTHTRLNFIFNTFTNLVPKIYVLNFPNLLSNIIVGGGSCVTFSQFKLLKSLSLRRRGEYLKFYKSRFYRNSRFRFFNLQKTTRLYFRIWGRSFKVRNYFRQVRYTRNRVRRFKKLLKFVVRRFLTKRRILHKVKSVRLSNYRL